VGKTKAGEGKEKETTPMARFPSLGYPNKKISLGRPEKKKRIMNLYSIVVGR
jgi:hypothetical protein